MPGSIHRNRVVKHFGTPDVTEGSVNEPREREEHGYRFNEKWVYKHPLRDPADAVERVVYWRRYDYVASMIRRQSDGELALDEQLPEKLASTE
ncbi:hypothetical protein L6Q96_09465 [Candidatus Binatia bacterium]|nr:hypothetical protein [Candidatus Binatia bacterium]